MTQQIKCQIFSCDVTHAGTPLFKLLLLELHILKSLGYDIKLTKLGLVAIGVILVLIFILIDYSFTINDAQVLITLANRNHRG